MRAAHDAGGGGGVAGWFDTLTGSWAAPYPETTGYIIPTFLGYSEATGDDDARERALRMTAWECDVQLASGAVVSGFAGASDEPAVFNTGQCLFGWATAYAAAGDERHRRSAEPRRGVARRPPGSGRLVAQAVVGASGSSPKWRVGWSVWSERERPPVAQGLLEQVQAAGDAPAKPAGTDAQRRYPSVAVAFRGQLGSLS